MMSASAIDPSPSALSWCGSESPKGFFRFLRAHHAYFHRAFAKWLHEAGFEVRWVRKRMNHHVWNLYLMSGTVLPGCERDTARQVIAETLNRYGVECPEKEIEVSVIENRVGAAFIFKKGIPGSLSFCKGAEQWCADEWP
jgi:hypothetical protein